MEGTRKSNKDKANTTKIKKKSEKCDEEKCKYS